MKKKLFGIVFLVIGAVGLLSITHSNSNNFSKLNNSDELLGLSVQDVLVELGDENPIHYLAKINVDSVRMGYELVYYGRLKDKTNKRISKFFVCTDCHNQVKEVENLATSTAEDRIAYGIKNNLPFLPASTFYGMYNKEHWYNGDYALKYGELVIPTRDSLDNAIQLCAVQCSQGRPLEKWELRSIIHYYKSIEIKIGDLNLTKNELDKLSYSLGKKAPKIVTLLKSKYNSINDAKFGDLNPKEPQNYTANFEKGKYIFEKGCLHCHGKGKDITNFEFDSDKLTFSFLESKLEKQNHFTIPYIVRKGTYAVSGHKQYMPQYPLEKMNNSQLFDLINYIKSESKK